MKKIAIIIAAYNCPDYILECVDSFKQQVIWPVVGWEIDLRIGVDGCKKTADMLKEEKIPFYWSPVNVGAYVMRNSLIHLEKADVYSYFDADDVMSSMYIKRILLKIKSGSKMVIAAKLQCDRDLIDLGKKPVIENGGAFTFTHEVLEALGGFYRHRCAGDSDFMDRAKKAGFKIDEIKEPLYLRRRHPESLTKSEKTKIGSEYRKKVWAEMTKKRAAGIIKIKPTIVKLEYVK